MQTEKEMRAHLIAKASDDAQFRSLLVSDPRQAVESEFGVTLSADISIHVHEETGDQAHLVLPSADSLSESDLDNIFGGSNAYAASNPSGGSTGGTLGGN